MNTITYKTKLGTKTYTPGRICVIRQEDPKEDKKNEGTETKEAAER